MQCKSSHAATFIANILSVFFANLPCYCAKPCSQKNFKILSKNHLQLRQAMLGMGRLPAPLPWLLCGRSAFFPRLAPRHPFQKVHPRVVEFSTDEPKAKEENSHVVGCTFGVVGTLAFGARTFCGQGFCGDCQAKLDVCFNLNRVNILLKKYSKNLMTLKNILSSAILPACGCWMICKTEAF